MENKNIVLNNLNRFFIINNFSMRNEELTLYVNTFISIMKDNKLNIEDFNKVVDYLKYWYGSKRPSPIELYKYLFKDYLELKRKDNLKIENKSNDYSYKSKEDNIKSKLDAIEKMKNSNIHAEIKDYLIECLQVSINRLKGDYANK